MYAHNGQNKHSYNLNRWYLERGMYTPTHTHWGKKIDRLEASYDYFSTQSSKHWSPTRKPKRTTTAKYQKVKQRKCWKCELLSYVYLEGVLKLLPNPILHIKGILARWLTFYNAFIKWASPGLFFSLISSIQYSLQMFNINFYRWLDSNCSLWCRKQPLFQLMHNHCPHSSMLFSMQSH